MNQIKKNVFVLLLSGWHMVAVGLNTPQNPLADLIRAVQEGNSDKVQKILATTSKEKLNTKDENGNGILLYTLENCTQKARNPDIEGSHSRGGPGYSNCCVENPGNIKIAELLIQAGADVNMPMADGQSMLIKALMGCSGAHLDIKVLPGNHYNFECTCIRTGKREMASLLLHNGANIAHKDKAGKSALDYAMNNMNVFPLFLPYLSSDDKKKVFLNAVNKNNNDIINLLWADVDLKGRDSNGKTWLIRMAKNGNIDFAKKILSNNADQLNTQDSAGATALMYAAKAGNGPLVKFLLLQDANFRLKDKQGRQAVDYARQADNKKMGEDIAGALSEVEKISMLLGRFPFGAQIQQTSIHKAIEGWQV